MKNFTKEDIVYRDILSNYIREPKEEKPIKEIECDVADLLVAPLWYHKKNLMQTASGYGKELRTEYKIRFEGRMYRVLCSCFSNSGTLYIKTKMYGNIIIGC